MKNKNKGFPVSPPKEFTIRLSNCGLDTINVSYKTMKDKDALKLALLVNHTMIKDFINKPDDCMNFQLDLACKLLKNVLKKDFKSSNVIQDIKEADKFIDKWKLKQPKSASPTSGGSKRK